MGWVATASVWWGEAGSCGPGLGHIIRHELGRGDGKAPPDAHNGWDEWHPAPTDGCGRCGAHYGDGVGHNHAGGSGHVWDTPSGELEPGCLFWADWHHVDVNKTACDTCKAGGGSIDTGDYHGVLRAGAFTAG